jgi:hypothetical protein
MHSGVGHGIHWGLDTEMHYAVIGCWCLPRLYYTAFGDVVVIHRPLAMGDIEP